MDKIIKVDDDDDGFGGSIADSRFIRGQILRWSDTGGWSDRDGLRPPEELLVLACNEGLQRWKGKKAESITTKPLPSPEELNASVPVAEWEPGIDGKLKPPWAHVAIVYLIDPGITAGLFTYLNSTIGAHIAWNVLREKVRTMRALRGERVLALVRLSTRPMKTTNFGMKTRPEFEIVGWRLLGGGGGNGGGSGPKVIQGPKAIENCPPATPSAENHPAEKGPPQKKPLAAADAALSIMEEVSFPSLSEEMDDTVSW